jgi:hypothetical protein
MLVVYVLQCQKNKTTQVVDQNLSLHDILASLSDHHPTLPSGLQPQLGQGWVTIPGWIYAGPPGVIP